MRAWLLLTACMGCTNPLTRSTDTTLSSSTVTALRGLDTLVTANPDENTVSFVHLPTEEVLDVQVGREPTRVAADHDRVWVTVRADNEVAALERRGTAWAVAGRATLGAEPYGIVVSPDGTRLYVAVSIDNEVVELDARTLDVMRRFRVGDEPRWLALHPTGRALAVASARGAHITLIGDLDRAEVTRESLDIYQTDGYFAQRVSGDPSFSLDGTRLVVPLTEVSSPLVLGLRPIDGYYATNAGISIVGADLARIGFDPRDATPTGDVDKLLTRRPFVPAHVAVLGASQELLVTLEGSADALELPDAGRTMTTTPTGRGPGGVAVDDRGDAWVHAPFERTVVRAWAPSLPISLGASALPDDVRIGRDLFYSAVDDRMTSGGISCATCHAEGRSDGVTWPLTSGDWQTPSLAGVVDDTAPVSWSQDVPSVRDEALLTITGPMAGSGNVDASAIAAFVNHVRLPNPPTPSASDEVLQTGEAAFRTAGCIGCHVPPLYTDNLHHAMFDQELVQTPTLLGIAASAPYLHDGRAPTLRTVLERSPGQMGQPEVLSDEEKVALVAWLRTL